MAGHTPSLHKSPQRFFIKLLFECSLLFRYDWTLLQERGKFLMRLVRRKKVVFQLLMSCKLEMSTFSENLFISWFKNWEFLNCYFYLFICKANRQFCLKTVDVDL